MIFGSFRSLGLWGIRCKQGVPLRLLNDNKNIHSLFIFKLLDQTQAMFSKIKNLFTPLEQTEKQIGGIPVSHPKVPEGSAASCPYAKKNMEGGMNKQSCPVAGKSQKEKKNQSDSEEEQQPRGGCPFMGGSDKKKNPNLGLSCEGYDEPFVSKFKYYLSANKLDFTAVKRGGGRLPASRECFEKYPIYLQHTLFYNGEDYKKVRGLECCSRFMAYEELRQKGNKHFNKGRFYRALDYYERAMSLFRWLEYHEDSDKSRVVSQANLPSERSFDEESDSGSKIQIPLSEQQTENDGLGDLRDKYKEFFVVYNDDNVRYFDGEELTENPDIDMRKSLLVQVYLNMAAAYINLNHYSLAEAVINDGLSLSDKVSQIYFRKAQSIALCKDSSMQRLTEAKKLIEKAIQMRPNEKIFNTANTNILRMLNLHDSAESYANCLQIVDKALANTTQRRSQMYSRIYSRAKEINAIEKRMIEQGKTPREGLNDKALYEATQMKILQRMIKKYERVVEFYTEGKNPEQVVLGKKQFQECLRVAREVEQIFSVNIVQSEDELGGVNSEKIQKRIAIIKTRFAEDVYNAGKYNFSMLQWVIKEIVKEEAEDQKRRKEEEASQNKQHQQPASSSLLTKPFTNKATLLLLIVPLALIIVSFFIL